MNPGVTAILQLVRKPWSDTLLQKKLGISTIGPLLGVYMYCFNSLHIREITERSQRDHREIREITERSQRDHGRYRWRFRICDLSTPFEAIQCIYSQGVGPTHQPARWALPTSQRVHNIVWTLRPQMDVYDLLVSHTAMWLSWNPKFFLKQGDSYFTTSS